MGVTIDSSVLFVYVAQERRKSSVHNFDARNHRLISCRRDSVFSKTFNPCSTYS